MSAMSAITLALSLSFLVIGCSGQEGIGIGGGSGGSFSGINRAHSSLSPTAQTALSALNQSASYEITADDLNALLAAGVLNADQVAGLRAELGL